MAVSLSHSPVGPGGHSDLPRVTTQLLGGTLWGAQPADVVSAWHGANFTGQVHFSSWQRGPAASGLARPEPTHLAGLAGQSGVETNALSPLPWLGLRWPKRLPGLAEQPAQAVCSDAKSISSPPIRAEARKTLQSGGGRVATPATPPTAPSALSHSHSFVRKALEHGLSRQLLKPARAPLAVLVPLAWQAGQRGLQEASKGLAPGKAGFQKGRSQPLSLAKSNLLDVRTSKAKTAPP